MIRVYNSAMAVSSEQALYLRDNAIRTMKTEQPVTQRVIEAVPVDKGELSTYLRPMGAKVPAIYGESYDSAHTKAGV